MLGDTQENTDVLPNTVKQPIFDQFLMELEVVRQVFECLNYIFDDLVGVFQLLDVVQIDISEIYLRFVAASLRVFGFFCMRTSATMLSFNLRLSDSSTFLPPWRLKHIRRHETPILIFVEVGVCFLQLPLVPTRT